MAPSETNHQQNGRGGGSHFDRRKMLRDHGWQPRLQKLSLLATWMSLDSYAGEGGITFPSQELLAKECGCTPRTIRRHLRQLCDFGLIEQTAYPAPGVRSEWRMLPPPPLTEDIRMSSVEIETEDARVSSVEVVTEDTRMSTVKDNGGHPHVHRTEDIKTSTEDTEGGNGGHPHVLTKGVKGEKGDTTTKPPQPADRVGESSGGGDGGGGVFEFLTGEGISEFRIRDVDLAVKVSALLTLDQCHAIIDEIQKTPRVKMKAGLFAKRLHDIVKHPFIAAKIVGKSQRLSEAAAKTDKARQDWEAERQRREAAERVRREAAERKQQAVADFLSENTDAELDAIKREWLASPSTARVYRDRAGVYLSKNPRNILGFAEILYDFSEANPYRTANLSTVMAKAGVG